MNFTVKKYVRENGDVPFDQWIKGLDAVSRARVYANLARIEVGNFGNVKPLQGRETERLFELRMFFGPGIRAYFGRDGETLILLLCGGDKKTQRKDITAAKRLWIEYKNRKGK